MDQRTEAFLAAARNGDPVYVTDVRQAYLDLPAEQSFRLDLQFVKVDGATKTFALRMPRFAGYDAEAARFVVDFFLAEVYNILSSQGGRALRLVNHDKAEEAERLLRAFNEAFEVDIEKYRRRGYGKCLNVIERMLPAVLSENDDGTERFAVELADTPWPERASPPARSGGAAEVFAQAAGDLDKMAILGIDIGGTDIKLALSVDGRLVCCKEYDWFPAAFTTAEQFIEPLVVLVRLMAFAALAAADRNDSSLIAGVIEKAMRKDADVATMVEAVETASKWTHNPGFRFDAIGISFPDVVVGDKIVGGEVSKTRGIRDAMGAGYDKVFAELTSLDKKLSCFVKLDGVVGIVNDGPMAAFTAGVEAAAADPASVQDGVFAHTLGTELGTGWVTEAGDFPDIPLEVYNFIIDLGSFPEKEFEPDDLRSLNNFNTRLPGTLQKYTSQSGVFRLALKYFPEARPDIMQELREAGFVVEREIEGRTGLYVPTAPKDMRKPFLEFMMNLVEREKEPVVDRIFEEIGVAMAVCGREVDWILKPAAKSRMLFGRLVKRQSCFDLMRKGAASYDSGAELTVADDGIAETPLMKELGRSDEYTIAQFAQAIGAVHYANYRLKKAR